MSVYHSKLNLMETEKALKDIKTIFERELSSALNLTRISAPLFVTRESGLNDNLNGVERPVSFDIKATAKPRKWCTASQNGSVLLSQNINSVPFSGFTRI